MSQPTQALIALGSNLDQPEQQIQNAVLRIGNLEGVTTLKASSLYYSSPRGPQDQDDYLNAALLIETSLSPLSLLNRLQSIENEMGRIKTRRWGERLIDLDIAFFGSEAFRSADPDLMIPHKEALIRDFVVIPCLEICPDWRLPNGLRLQEFLDQCDSHTLKKIDVSLACS